MAEIIAFRWIVDFGSWFRSGYGPKLSARPQWKKLVTILSVISCLLICFLFIPCTLCTILVDTDLDTKIRMIGPVSFFLMAAMKQYILIIRSENIDECIRHIRVNWSRVALNHEKDREIMVNNTKFGRWLFSISAIFMYSSPQ